MFKISDVISKPVYSMYEGVQAGTIKNFLYNSKRKSITGFFVFDDESDAFQSFLKKEDVFLIGKDFVFIKNSEKVKASFVREDPIINLKAISSTGENLGRLSDVFFDEKFKVLSFETSSDIIIPAELLINLGKDVAIFDVENVGINISRMKPKAKILFEEVPNIKVSILEEGPQQVLPVIASKKEISFPAKLLSNPQSIIGKTATQTVYGLNGEIVVKTGQLITDKVYQKAKKHSKLFELTNVAE